MSTSESVRTFEHWLAAKIAATGSFAALIVLVDISETQINPLVSTHLNIIGTEVDWNEITVRFAGAGVSWNGAAFLPIVDVHGGPLGNPTAQIKLCELETRFGEDRLVLNKGASFDKRSRKLQVEEVDLQ